VNKDTSWGYKTIITPASATRQFAKEPILYPLWSCSKRLVSYHDTHKVNYTSSVFIIKYPFTFSPFHPFTLKYLTTLSSFPPFIFSPFPLPFFPLFTLSPFHLFPLSSFPLSTFPSFHFFTLSPLNTLSPFIAWLGLKLFIRNNVPSCQN